MSEADRKQLTEGLGGELADLSTAIEGTATLVCEAVGQPDVLANRAQQLWSSIRRLRFLSDKVMTAGRTPAFRTKPTEVSAALHALRAELGHLTDGLQIELHAATALPPAMADQEALKRALLFLVHAMLEREPDARLLTLRTSTEVTDYEAPRVVATVEVESEAGFGADRNPDRVPIAEAAARNLLAGMGAELDLKHRPGLRCRARVALTAATVGRPVIRTTSPPRLPHPFGGVLLLDDDPMVRSLIQTELSGDGRRVISCADGTAARSLFRATPERFELMVLEAETRRGRGAVLAAEALAATPDVRVLLLTASDDLWAGEAAWPDGRWAELRKPFGIPELRSVVQQLLGPPSAVPQPAEPRSSLTNDAAED
ncbi:MAG: response regulator [Planctomycetota bacterium]